jgi:hypothetical protein
VPSRAIVKELSLTIMPEELVNEMFKKASLFARTGTTDGSFLLTSELAMD